MTKKHIHSHGRDKIIWALDPNQDPQLAKNLVAEMKLWAHKLNCDIQPVTVTDSPSFPMEKVSLYLNKLQVRQLLPTHLIIEKLSSARAMASALARYAEREKAQFIFVNTHAKKSWIPFQMGGFAESLITTSRVPILIMNTHTRPSLKLSSVLFPTDFQQDSKRALLHLEPILRKFDAHVILYNLVERQNIYPPDVQYSWSNASRSFTIASQSVEKTRQKKAKEWIHHLEDQNVKCSSVIKPQKRNLSSSILDIAKKNHVGLIAMSSTSGPLAQALLGSVARDVLLQAKCPVLVYYRPKKRAGVKQPSFQVSQTKGKEGFNYAQ
ncbi:MAG: hypothetical protein BroJett040_14580 [Oligoflexia bacterium]|nr:MAG: hypothetical protein BroJett040_14580 [Oligoflexia bacterium]